MQLNHIPRKVGFHAVVRNIPNNIIKEERNTIYKWSTCKPKSAYGKLLWILKKRIQN
jgi:hypothetical protein